MFIGKTKLLTFIIPPVIFLGLGFVFFSSTCVDDASITWYSAYSLSAYGEMQEYEGERVEQSSSLLNVLMIAVVRKITGADISIIGPLLSIFFGLLSIAATTKITAKILPEERSKFSSAIIIATAYPLVYWSLSGLDATLAAWSLTMWGLFAVNFISDGKKSGGLILYSAFYLMSRPEGFFISAFGLLVLLIFSGITENENRAAIRRKILLAFLIILLIFAALCLFRWMYFERVFPEPVYTKASGLNFYKLKKGLKYILSNFAMPVFSIWMIIFVAGIFRRKNEGESVTPVGAVRTLKFLAAGIVAGTFLFNLLTGGDWMENARYFVPVIPVVIAVGACYLQSNLRWSRMLIVLLLITNLFTVVYVSARINRGRPAWTWGNVKLTEAQRTGFTFFQIMNRDGERDIPAFIKLDEVFQKVDSVNDTKKVVIMSGVAGFIISELAQKHPHKFIWIDQWGLSDKTVAECPPAREIELIPEPSWDYHAYFRILDRIHKECPAFYDPDIIFEFEDYTLMELLEKKDYRIVYHQTGCIDSGHHLFAGQVFNAGLFIAVKKSLADKAGLDHTETEDRGACSEGWQPF